MFWADFGADIMVVAVLLCGALVTQLLFSKAFVIAYDFRSPLITALSLSMLLRTNELWIYLLAVIAAIASKFLLRIRGKHIFNPANIGIVLVLLLFSDVAWVSPGQWGSALWLAALLCFLSFLVLFKIPYRDMALLFLCFWSGLLFMRALWLGDPLSIPLHQLQSGALLIFAFFMISDPKTIPDTLKGRIVFALSVAVLAYILTFTFRIRESLFYALAILCIFRPIIDYIWAGRIYHWRPKKGEEAL